MRIITFNANGIRSAADKGFFRWLSAQDADVVCVQETRARIDQLSDGHFRPEGYHCSYYDAERPGYAGTALYSRRKPDAVTQGLGWEPVDSEARWLQADFPGLSVVSLYMPSGSSGPERQARKIEMMTRLMPHLRELRESGREWVICADWNICHKEIDLKNWRGNRKNSGFLPEERAWLDELLGPVGFVDAFRIVNPHPDQYTWWSNRGRARENNVGWRLDYMVTTPGIAAQLRAESVYRDERFSDHAPLTMDFDWPPRDTTAQ
jgi:exodeoxyribonuclease-3